MNALVQGQKATLGLLLQPDTIGTLMRCITADNGAAPGTVRLLLVVFLHSGKHEELRQQLLAEPEVRRNCRIIFFLVPKRKLVRAPLASALC